MSIGWWLMGCPFTKWKKETKVPWDYRIGMRVYNSRFLPKWIR